MAKIIIPQSEGRYNVRPANRMTQAADEFGRAVVNAPGRVAQASVEAFGDSSGQMAIANAVGGIGDDLGKFGEMLKTRDDSLKKASDDIQYKKMVTDYGIGIDEALRDIEKQGNEEGWSADRRKEEFETRQVELRNKIADSYEFKTITQEALTADFDIRERKSHNEFMAGAFNRYRTDEIKNTMFSTLNNYRKSMDSALFDGNINKATAATNDAIDFVQTPQFIALNGSAKSAELQHKLALEFTQTLVKSQAQVNDPNGALMILETPTIDAGGVSLPNPVFSLMEKYPELRDDVREIVLKEQENKKREFDRSSSEKLDSALLQFAQGKIGMYEVKQLVGGSDLNDADKLRLYSAAERKRKEDEAKRKSMDAHRIDLEMGISRRGNANTKEERRARNEIWNEHLKIAQSMPPEQQNAYLVDKVVQMEVVPPMAKQILHTQLNSDDPNQHMQALNFLGMIYEQNPTILSENFDEKDNVLFDRLYHSGHSFEQAKELEKQESEAMFKQKLRDNSPYFKIATKKDKEGFTPIENVLNDKFGDGVVLPQELKNFANSIYVDKLTQHSGDEELAKRATLRQIEQQWGTTVTGRDGKSRVAFNPPESFVSTYRGDKEWVNKQFESDMQLGFPQVDVRKVEPVINPKSLKQTKVNYFIRYVNDDGEMFILQDETGKPYLWAPDLEAHKKHEDSKPKSFFEKLSEYEG